MSLDHPHVRERAMADPVGFLDDNAPPVILDEIQHAPTLLPYIKAAIDQDRAAGRWILAGSQPFRSCRASPSRWRVVSSS